jgi:hypothetical protein
MLCDNCNAMFRTREQLRRHKNRYHRDNYTSTHGLHLPHVVPSDVDGRDLTVKRMYPVGRRIPPGYPAGRPLVKVSYTHHLQRVQNMVVVYDEDFKRRFAREILDYFMSVTTIKGIPLNQ